MPDYTSELNLRKINMLTDSDSNVNIETDFNENWDKIDQFAGSTTAQLADKFQSTTVKETTQFGPELLTSSGWTSVGWTGDFVSGFTHTVGQTSSLSYPAPVVAGKIYKVELTLTNVSQGEGGASYNDFTLSIGGSATFEVYAGTFDEHTFVYGIQSLNGDPLIITPRAEYDGVVSNISVKEVIGTIEPLLGITDSYGGASFEARPLTGGKENLFIGVNSGELNFAGYGNVGVGVNALKTNTAGFWNTAAGLNAMLKNTIGTRNVSLGFNSLYENIAGDRNVAIGTYALHRNTGGRNNIALGADTLWNNTTGSNNIGISNCALDHNTTGSNNVALGYYSMYNNTTGSTNIALGYMALNKGAAINGNVGIGEQALYNNTANYNVGIGRKALIGNTSGADNVGVGNNVLPNNVTGSGNVAIGTNAGGASGSGDINRNVAIGINAGAKLSTGATSNILIGGSAGSSTLTTGSNNILIGDSVNPPATNTNYHLNIGNLIYGDMMGYKLGVRVQSPTAFLHVRQGNTETPPIKIDKGTSLVSSPQVGALEFVDGGLYFTDATGTRKQVSLA